MTNTKKRHKFVLWGQPKVFRTHFLTFGGYFSPKSAFFWRFPALAQKIYFIQIFYSGQNIMSLLKQNIHFRPTCLTDWTPNPKKPLNPAEKAPLDPP